MIRTMTKRIPKPFSEMRPAAQLAEAYAAIARLNHPHNRYDRNCQEAIQRWQQTINRIKTEPAKAEG